MKREEFSRVDTSSMVFRSRRVSLGRAEPRRFLEMEVWQLTLISLLKLWLGGKIRHDDKFLANSSNNSIKSTLGMLHSVIFPQWSKIFQLSKSNTILNPPLKAKQANSSPRIKYFSNRESRNEPSRPFSKKQIPRTL